MSDDVLSKNRERIKERMDFFLEAVKNGEQVKLTDDDKTLLIEVSKGMFAEILDLEPDEINDDSHLLDDLGMDSLAFLEMFDEFKEIVNLDLDVNTVAKYAQEHPVETFGEYMEQTFVFVENPDAVLKELGLDKDEMIQKAEGFDLDSVKPGE